MFAATLRLSRNEAKTQKDCFEYYPSQWLQYFLNRSRVRQNVGQSAATLFPQPGGLTDSSRRSKRSADLRYNPKTNCTPKRVPEVNVCPKNRKWTSARARATAPSGQRSRAFDFKLQWSRHRGDCCSSLVRELDSHLTKSQVPEINHRCCNVRQRVLLSSQPNVAKTEQWLAAALA